MTDSLAELRTVVEAMTPGEWHHVRYGEAPEKVTHSVRTRYFDAEKRRITCWPAVCDCGNEPNEANATGIVTAVAIARFVAAPESVGTCARVAREAWLHEPVDAWEAVAKAALTLIARAANAE